MTQPAPQVVAAPVAVRATPSLLLLLGLLALVGLIGILILLGLHDSIPAELWALESLTVGAIAGVAVPARLP